MSNNEIKIERTIKYIPQSVQKPTAGSSSGVFKQALDQSLRENYKERVESLFNDIKREVAGIMDGVDFVKFERYRTLIRDLLAEVVNNAFSVSREYIFDKQGKQRVYSTVSVIDEKLDKLASELLTSNMEVIKFLERMDEIRGLITDLLF
ncbi:MAG: YaaR family protein [Eubacteriales bacterium]|jgi:uncharacterized protein YaaR (DUF327 family)|nr:YaaR family protein [Clostridiales bacterium]